MDIVVPCYLIDMFSSKHGQKGFRRVRHPCGLGDTPKSFRMGAHVPLINWKSNRFSENPQEGPPFTHPTVAISATNPQPMNVHQYWKVRPTVGRICRWKYTNLELSSKSNWSQGKTQLVFRGVHTNALAFSRRLK